MSPISFIKRAVLVAKDIIFNFNPQVSFEGDLVTTASRPQFFAKQMDDPWTVSFWYKSITTSSTIVTPITNTVSTSNNGEGMAVNAIDGVNFTFLGIKMEDSVLNATANWSYPRTRFTWQNIVVTYDGSRNPYASSIQAYVNGKLFPINAFVDPPASGTITYPATTFILGRAPAGSFTFDDTNFVYMKDIVLWDTHLTANEAKEIWNFGVLSDISQHSRANFISNVFTFDDDDTVTLNDSIGGEDAAYANMTLPQLVSDIPPLELFNKSYVFPSSIVANSGAATDPLVTPSLMFAKQWDDPWTIMWWAKNDTVDILYQIFNNTSIAGNPADGMTLGVTTLTGDELYVLSWDSDTEDVGRVFRFPITTGSWNHYAMTYDGSRNLDTGLKFYKNANEVAGLSAANPSPTGTIPYNATFAGVLGAGEQNVINGKNVKVTDISFWGVEFSQADVNEAYNTGQTNLEEHTQTANLEHWYHMTNNEIRSEGTLFNSVDNEFHAHFGTGTAVSNESTDIPDDVFFALNKSFEGFPGLVPNNGMVLSTTGAILEKDYDDPWTVSLWIKKTVAGTGTDFSYRIIKHGTSGPDPSEGMTIRVTGDGRSLLLSWDTATQNRGFLSVETDDRIPLFGIADEWTLFVVTYNGGRDLSTDVNVYSNTFEFTNRGFLTNPGPTDVVTYPQAPVTSGSNTFEPVDGNGAADCRVVDIAFWGTHFSVTDVGELYNAGARIDPREHSKASFIENHFPFTNDVIGSLNTIRDEALDSVTGNFESAITSSNFSTDVPPTGSVALNKSFQGSGTSTGNDGMELSSTSIFEKDYDDPWTISFKIRRVSASTMSYVALKHGSITTDPAPGLNIQITGSGDSMILSWDTSTQDRGCTVNLPGSPLSTTTDWTTFTITYDGSRDFSTGLQVYSNTTVDTGKSSVSNPIISDVVNYPQTPVTAGSSTHTQTGVEGATNCRVTDISLWGSHFSADDVSELHNNGTRVSSTLHSKANTLEHYYTFINETINNGNTILDVYGGAKGSFESSVTGSNSSVDVP